ncbi:MAG: aspartate/glutamate racemase family protein [Candidatus Hermodarchaeota archaeon]
MKTIGLVGGTGWISTVTYYQLINETINKRLGGLNAAKCVLYSVNFAEIDQLKKHNDTSGIFEIILDAATKVINAGADCLLLCANTLHYYAEDLEDRISVPLIHIANATAKKIKESHISKVGLLGTKKTMEQDFYRSKLQDANVQAIVPDEKEREFIDNAIMNEFLKGIFKKATKANFLDIIKNLEVQGAEGIILGCTEIPLIIEQADVKLPVFNTTLIHSLAAVDFALNEDSL